MAFLHPESGDFGTLINAFAVGFLVLPRRLFLALLTFQGIRHFGHRDGQIPGPQFVVERVGAAHLIFREQVMKSGISHTGVERPMFSPNFIGEPVDEAATLSNLVGLLGVRSVGSVNRLSTLCGVTGRSALIALARRCTTLQFV